MACCRGEFVALGGQWTPGRMVAKRFDFLDQSVILRTGVLEAFLFPRDTGNRASLPARMFRQSVLERREGHPS